MKINKLNLMVMVIAAALFAPVMRNEAQQVTTVPVPYVPTNAGVITNNGYDLYSVAPATNAVQVFKDIVSVGKASGLLHATNYAFEPYVTYAPKLPTKVGAGVLAIYNVNSYVGAGLGVDYLGQFSLVSGNATLKYPMAVGKYLLPYVPASWEGTVSNLTVTPFALGGLASPLSGGGGAALTTVADVGNYIEVGHLWGGKFNLGVCWGEWANAGDYSGHRYHAFAGWSKGF